MSLAKLSKPTVEKILLLGVSLPQKIPHGICSLTGDVRAGALLSFLLLQMLLPKSVIPKVVREDKEWLVATAEQIIEHVPLTVHEYRAAVKVLKDLNFLETKVWVYGDGTATHHHIPFMSIIEQVIERM